MCGVFCCWCQRKKHWLNGSRRGPRRLVFAFLPSLPLVAALLFRSIAIFRILQGISCSLWAAEAANVKQLNASANNGGLG